MDFAMLEQAAQESMNAKKAQATRAQKDGVPV